MAVVASSISSGIWSKVDDLATERAKTGQLDRAGPVVDERLLVEVEVVEGRLGVAAGPARSSCSPATANDRPGTHGEDDEEDEDEGDGDQDAADDRPAVSLGAPLQRSSSALPPRDSGLHLSPHDSIGSVNGRSFPGSPGHWSKTRQARAL